MIKKRITAYLIIFTLLCSLIPSGRIAPVYASSSPVVKDGKLMLIDFGNNDFSAVVTAEDVAGSDGILASNNVFAESTKISDSAAQKTSSLEFDIEGGNKNIRCDLLYKHSQWLENGDIKYRIYNESSQENRIVIYFYDATDVGEQTKYVEKISLSSGWNTGTISKSSIDVAFPDKENLRVSFSTGWNSWTSTRDIASSVYIDSVWCEFPNYGETVSAPEPVIKNGAAYLDADLGNNNTYTLNCAEKIWAYPNVKSGASYNVSDYITVYEKSDSSYTETSQPYDVLVDSASLNVEFTSSLETGIYKVVVNSDAFLTSTGKVLSKDAEYYFSVNTDSAIFTVDSVSHANNVTGIVANKSGYKYTISFNNKPSVLNLENMISVTEDDTPFDAYTVSSAEKDIILTFTSPLKSLAEYKITLSDSLADTNGSNISGTKVFSFTTAKTVGDDGVLFDASNASDMACVTEKPGGNFNVIKDTEAAFLGDKTIKFAKNGGTNAYSFKLADKVIPDITEYSYVNCLIYSPEKLNDSFYITLGNSANDDSNNNYYTVITTDWEGWKTISVPLSDLKTSGTMSGNQVDSLRLKYDNKKTAPSYILIDRVWLTDTIPTQPKISSAEYADGAVSVPSTLGGDNAYSFKFNINVLPKDIEKAITVEKYNGKSHEAYSDCTINVNGKGIDISFNSALDGIQTFKLSLNMNKILFENYTVGEGKSEYEFTTLSSVANGANADTLTELSFAFDTAPDPSQYVPEYVSIYKNGEKLYNAFTFDVDENLLTLKFNEPLSEGNYNIKLSPDYADISGNKYTGSYNLTFTVGKTDDKLVIFSAENEAYYSVFKSSKYSKIPKSEVKDTTILYDYTSKFSYVAGTTAHDGYMKLPAKTDISGMNYLNLLMYSHKATENVAHIALYTDYANKTYNGQKYELPLNWQGWKIVSVPIANLVSGDSIEAVLFNLCGWQHKEIFENGYVLFDAVWFSKDEVCELALSKTSFPNGYTDALVTGEVLTLDFTADIDTNIVPTVTLTDEGGNPVGSFSYSINGKSIRVDFDTLTPSHTYKLSISGLMSTDFSRLSNPVEISFTTVNDGIFLKDLLYDEGSKKVTAALENLSSNPIDVTLVAYALSNDGICLDKQIKVITASSDGAVTSDGVIFSSAEEINAVKAVVLDGKNRILSDKYLSVIGGSALLEITSQLIGTQAKAHIVSGSVNVSVLSSPILLSATRDAALIELISPSGSILSADIIKTNTDGTNTFYFEIPDSEPTGNYTLKLIAGMLSDTEVVKYVSKSDRDTLLLLANGSSADDLYNHLIAIKDYIGLSSYTNSQIKDFASVIVDNKPHSNYPAVLDFIERLTSLLTNINSASWGKLTALIEQNGSIFGSDTNTSYFVSLGDEQQNAISQILVSYLPQNTMSGFLSVLGQAISDYQSKPSSKPQYGSALSGGGSSSVSFQSTPVTNPYTPAETVKVFDDLADVSWATDSIMTLYNEGVLSASSDKKFRPNDNVTREEFVKMIVCAFVKDASSTSHRFADAQEGAWYNSYLSIAYSLGITKGYADGSFGVGQNITREDMVTICSRTLEIMGNSVVSYSAASFADSSQISDYATEYVNAMASLGVVNGMGDGTFAPKANATRAQAAKIIAKLMELY